MTTKTVRRRFERMTENNAVIIVPLVNPADIPGTITHTMLLHPSPDQRNETLAQAMNASKDSCFLAVASSPGNTMVCLSARTLAEAENSLIRARKIEGMKDVKLIIQKEMREYTQWLDSAIDRKTAETAGTSP